MAKHDHHEPEIDAVSGTVTTGHSWDGIKELNTPLPRWWLWTFYLTIIWSVGYWIVYPAWPMISDHTRGLLGYSSRAHVAVELAALEARRASIAAGLADASVEAIRANPELMRIALARGRAAFGDNCVPCHGPGGAGATGGYPSLVDDEWIWGGTPADIEHTIRHGIRWEGDPETRTGVMIAFGRTGVLNRQEIETVVDHVRLLAGLDVPAGFNREKGAELYAANCASCHGDAGKGMKEVGAPDLTDAIWLYGSSRAAMIDVVQNGRGGVMPPWQGRLDATTIKALTVYVHSLGGGQ